MLKIRCNKDCKTTKGKVIIVTAVSLITCVTFGLLIHSRSVLQNVSSAISFNFVIETNARIKPTASSDEILSTSTALEKGIGSNNKSVIPLVVATHNIVTDSTHTSSSTLRKKKITKDHEYKSVKRFDCAVNWIRIPKTASTSVLKVFILPLLNTGGFQSTYLTANACVLGVGECSSYWNETESARSAKDVSRELAPIYPPYGIAAKAFSEGSDVSIGESSSSYGERCFTNLTEEKKTSNSICYEFDATKRILNFGPRSRVPHSLMKRLESEKNMEARADKKREGRKMSHVFSKVNATINFSPDIKDHVGFDPSLLGWILPSTPMVFSAFRDPLERLMSSFHYGIRYGATRPGEVKSCRLMYSPHYWRPNIVEARLLISYNNSTKYFTMLRNYLRQCRIVIDNVYTQFLDPHTKNLSVALDNLDRYVIVGLQNDMAGTLERWANITMRSCKGNEKFLDMKKEMYTQLKLHSTEKFNERINPSNGSTSGSVAPTIGIESFDRDLRRLIRRFISEDTVIYKRVLELYEDQRHWGLVDNMLS